MVKGEITVFLSLVFLLLLTLVGALLESASIQLAKNERRADAGRAVESAFAEYQKDLLERYGIFAFLVAAMAAGAGLWSGKWKRTTRMSFYPFLLIGYLGTFIW